MEQMQRKKNRLTDYDYSTAGAYFITVCTKGRKPLLATIAPYGYREHCALV
jgi:hypothetical protein